MASKKTFDFDDPDNISKCRALLLDGCKNAEFSLATTIAPWMRRMTKLERGLDEDHDTDASELIEVRDEDSNTEQSGASSSESEEESENSYFYVAEQKRGNVTNCFLWKKIPYNSEETENPRVLTGITGVTGPAKGIEKISDIWLCLFDDHMLDDLVNCTNQYIDGIKGKFTRARDALPTSLREMKAFIGLLYLAGTYNSTLPELWHDTEIFRLTMSLRRFRFLMSSLRFDDLETREERKKLDRLAAVRDLTERFVKNCQSCFSVSADVTIDEKLDPFRGRCRFIQHIPSKPAVHGIKVFALVDSNVLYTSNLEIYVGEQPDGPFRVSNESADVVKRMIAPIENSGRNVTADSWFSDVNLLRDLAKDHGLTYVGALKKSKWQIPKEFKVVRNRAAYSSVFGFTEEGTLLSYVPHNTKEIDSNIIMISSQHKHAICEKTWQRKVPQMLTYYNQHKIAVGMVDRICNSCNVQRGATRWSLAVFYSLLNVAGVNSQIIHLGNGNQTQPRRFFLRQLGRELILDQLVHRAVQPNNPRLGARIRNVSPRYKKTKSIPKKIPTVKQIDVKKPRLSEANKNGKIKRKRCWPCYMSEQKTRRLTQYSCMSCGMYFCLQHCSFICSGGCPRKEQEKTRTNEKQELPITTEVEPFAEESWCTANESSSFQTEHHPEDGQESILCSETGLIIKKEGEYLHHDDTSTSSSEKSLDLNTEAAIVIDHCQNSECEEDPLSISEPETKKMKLEADGRISVQCEKNSERNPLDDFFQAMATSVKALPPLLQLQVKQKVTQAVFEAESVMLSMG